MFYFEQEVEAEWIVQLDPKSFLSAILDFLISSTKPFSLFPATDCYIPGTISPKDRWADWRSWVGTSTDNTGWKWRSASLSFSWPACGPPRPGCPSRSGVSWERGRGAHTPHWWSRLEGCIGGRWWRLNIDDACSLVRWLRCPLSLVGEERDFEKQSTKLVFKYMSGNEGQPFNGSTTF